MRATITSKGQVTIPKTIRDILEVGEKDEIEFLFDSNGKITVSKTKVQNDIPSNILDLCLDSNLNVAILGMAGVGKTTLIKQLVQQKGYQNIVLQESFKELEYLLELENVYRLKDWKNESNLIDILLIEEINRQEEIPLKLLSSKFPTIMTAHFNLESHTDVLEKVLLPQFPVFPDILVFMDKYHIKEIKRVVQREEIGLSLKKQVVDFITIYKATNL